MKTITEQEQKKLLLEMLVEFDRFCTAHGLRYYLHCGTLLGAVRHKGFIPWDDDIDVAMPRWDYERFIRIYNEEKTEEDYEVVSFHNTPDFYLPFGKLIHNKTRLAEAVDSELKLGLYLDIFPLDNMGNTPEEAKKLYDEVYGLRQKLIVQNLKLIRERAFYKNVVIFFAKLFSPKNARRGLIEQIDKRCRVYESEKMTEFIAVNCAANYGMKEILRSEWYEEYETVPFEEHAVRIPKGWHYNLSQFYGDYMQLPPAEKQKSHHIYQAEWIEEPE